MRWSWVPGCAAALALVMSASASAQSGPAPFCLPGQTPTFDAVLVDMNERLGGVLGEPLECAHPDMETGEAVQQTTTGLARFDLASGRATFVSGEQHWQLTGDDLVSWSVAPATPEIADAAQPAPSIVAAVVADAANRQQIDSTRIQVMQARHVEWPNSSLGCPQPGAVYLQVITPGWAIFLDAGGQRMNYHTDEGSRLVFCPTLRPGFDPAPLPRPGAATDNT